MANKFIKLLDQPMWRPVATQPNITLGQNNGPVGSGVYSDLRSRDYGDPNLWCTAFTTANSLVYNKVTNAWTTYTFTTPFGGTASGMFAQFVPSQGPSGTLAAGSTSTIVNISTAFPAAVIANALSNRGDGLGYIIRIIGNASGSSGKICERRIIANTSGTTPSITLDAALDFTPATGDRYELLSGSWYIMTTGASKEFRRYDVATDFMSAALSLTNLPGTIGAAYNDLVTLDEAYVPYNHYPGEGMVRGASTYDTGTDYIKFCLTATATAAGTITGQVTGGDSGVLVNQFRNYQIRIVQDTAIPTAVGQRRRITSHTVGASPIYTLASNWTVTPSATAMYVIEQDNDKLIYLTNSTVVYNYNITSGLWDTTTWAARGTAPTGGLGSVMAFGLAYSNVAANTRSSCLFSYRGIGTGNNPIDVLDISGAATGSWSSFTTITSVTQLLGPATGGGCVYDPITNEGKYVYFSGPYTNNGYLVPFFRLNLRTKTVNPYAPASIVAGQTADQANNKLGIGFSYISGSEVYSFLYFRAPQNATGTFYQLPILI
ncbi:hypothetical protein UFOVP1492_115 [uncultured Caudovirales phage]|uniref:Uncharacterized protein n=1 Tax=uncultured Caudovirales phage TaxID=2100421 RepID=A0A6J7XMV4_9CAUD|nr:hypothetical protein UFOVP1127_19 [uncultured Caudovirales phage]CAB4193295.1 hypothetical protein UFOVP1242_55 [uncultured Caudovirales phage]CAB4217879.1 hypothetical protein UFOVP1492_115 [uncultured Caudovirales phage]CAB5230983.1 hypothetical protein UFOVP1580_8 [uncultured Caudovirales phage]